MCVLSVFRFFCFCLCWSVITLIVFCDFPVWFCLFVFVLCFVCVVLELVFFVVQCGDMCVLSSFVFCLVV